MSRGAYRGKIVEEKELSAAVITHISSCPQCKDEACSLSTSGEPCKQKCIVEAWQGRGKLNNSVSFELVKNSIGASCSP
jgi:hypothetical protein